MDPLLEIGKQIPALAVLVFLTMQFLKNSRAQAIENASIIGELRDALHENTKTLGRVLEHFNQNS